MTAVDALIWLGAASQVDVVVNVPPCWEEARRLGAGSAPPVAGRVKPLWLSLRWLSLRWLSLRCAPGQDSRWRRV